jgi:hypothetical protein
MNATQHRPTARLADLSPFDIRVSIESPTSSPRVGKAACRELLKGGTKSDAGYGCVDWYQYPGRRADGATTAH